MSSGDEQINKKCRKKTSQDVNAANICLNASIIKGLK